MKLAHNDLDFISNLLQQRAALVLGREKGYLIESRLSRVAREQQISTLPELVKRLRRHDRRLETAVVEAMLTHETSFFRDKHPFNSLRNLALPKLLQARAKTRTLNLWSAACSSGQEPYSLAMLLLDAFPELATWRVKIVATDLSTSVLGRAAAARYSQLEVARGLPPGYKERFFKRSGGEFEVVPQVRRLVKFEQCNLKSAWPQMPKMDVVFIRNVMIYFDGKTKEGILKKAHRGLSPDGFLYMGSTETMPGLEGFFTRKNGGGSSFYQKK